MGKAEILRAANVEHEATIHPWTEIELSKAFARILGPRNSADPNRFDPITDHDAHIVRKGLLLDGIDYYCALLYQGPYDYVKNSFGYFVPFPEITKFQIGENGEVTSVPLVLEVGRFSGKIDLLYRLKIEGMESLLGVGRTDKTDLEDIEENGVIIGRETQELVLPSDPKKLSTMEFTFLRPGTQFPSL
ncbi:hypothetical protein A3C59_04935 [Candidatus Daviesbacteria bacterium RIFCSPHIGHO2_02_FULL_36_13]|uniref:Uncharacterized protein n=1 Tax=Candidatus Daviesbacteria bacterium RIFCSPHIGHO2_02_FULL_36_13 TaxID=1797768 RepID=A0A1F5JNW6_9BACT|nr:MAG: hypothetical protein A3C59_04935 [Candidatus Daviesbacteria bacterium RIFCSPHIGHO2_02_FULL_36_13]